MDQSTALAQIQQNAAAREIVLRNSVKMVQAIANITVDPTQQNVLNIQPRNVGLTLGFFVNVSCNLTNGAATQADLTPFGVANLIQQLTYTDLQNLQRIQTTGYHLAFLNSAKQGFVFGGAYSPGIPIDYGNNWPVFDGPANIAATDTADVRMVYWVPLAYSGSDLRGAVYTGIVNATQNLQIVLNQTPFVGAVPAADPLNAVYQGNANGAYTDNITVQVYQVFRDQIPFQGNVPILPVMDLNTVYDIKNTTLTGMATNADFPFAFPNMRDFLSTIAIFDNGGAMNVGDDVNYWSLTSANSTALFQIDPLTAALFARQTFMSDPPPGTYYFDWRDKPINTVTFGNMTLNLNASTVNTNAKLVILTEAFQQVNQIPYAASLSIGN